MQVAPSGLQAVRRARPAICHRRIGRLVAPAGGLADRRVPMQARNPRLNWSEACVRTTPAGPRPHALAGPTGSTRLPQSRLHRAGHQTKAPKRGLVGGVERSFRAGSVWRTPTGSRRDVQGDKLAAVGLHTGYSRLNGQYADTAGQPKTMPVYPLRPDARARLRAPEAPPEWPRLMPYGHAEWRSLLELLEEVPGRRQGQRCAIGVARRWRCGAGASVRLAVWMADGRVHPSSATKDLEPLGCPFNRRAQRYEAPSDTTFRSVLAHMEPSLERVVPRWTTPRCPNPLGLGGFGKRIRGANHLTPDGTP